MNQLFSRKRKASLAVICICILFYNFSATVKEKITDPFLTLCKNSDAYYSYTNTTVSYSRSWPRYKKTISVQSKLVINTPKGVEDFAFLNLNKYISNNIKKIKVKTLKSSGSIIELDSSLVFKQNTKNKKFNAISYPIPGVEPGDTIVTSYVYVENLKKYNLKNYVDFHTTIPSKNSQYTIKPGSGLEVQYKSYNDFPKPVIISNDTLVSLQFSIKKITGKVENKHNCLPCELPYLYYAVQDKNSKTRTWIDIYNQEFNFITQPMALDTERSSYYKRWKRKVLKEVKDSSKFYQLNLLYSEILNKFKMEPIQEKEVIKSSGYFLKEKRFDPISIRRFYRQILEDLDIEYWAVFGKSKRLGTIDPHYIRKGEFDHIFFAYRNEKGAVKILYPHDEFYMYQIDETPTSLYSTDAILVKPYYRKSQRKKNKFITSNFSLARADSVSVSEIVLPGMDSNNNYINQTISFKVDAKKKKTSFRYRFKVSGGLSTELRAFFEMLKQNKEASSFYDALSEFEGSNTTMKIDTVTSRRLNRMKPYTYIMNAEGTLNDGVTFINDSLISVSIDKLIQHNQLDSTSDASQLNYYLDYSYSDKFLFYINFPSNIEILGFENGNVDFKNKHGEYYFELIKSKDKQLKIQSNYIVLKNLIPKENYKDIKLLNEQVKKVKSRRLIIKLF